MMIKKKFYKIVGMMSFLDKDKLVLLLLFLISSILTAIWFRNRDIMAGGESGLLFYDLKRFSEISKYSWTDLNLGNSVGIGSAAIPTYWLLSKLKSLNLPSFFVQALFFDIVFLFSGTFIYLISREIFPKLGLRYALIAVLFYWFNPISLVNVWNRFLYNYMVFWALLPVVFFFFLRGLSKKDYRYCILTSLSTILFSFALTSVVFNMILWFFLFYLFLFFFIIERYNRIFYIKYFVLTFVSFVFFNFWWIGQLFSFVFSSAYKEATIVIFSSTGNLSTLSSLSQRLGQLVNVYRFLHITFFENGLAWAKTYLFTPLVFLEFIITALILWTIYKYRKSKYILLLGTLFFITIFLMKGNEEPFGEVFQAVFKKFVPLQVFRNPFEKFGFLLPLTASLLFAYGLEQFVLLQKNNKLRKLFIFSVSSFIIFVWGFPFWTGLVFTREIDKETKELVSYEIRVPDYYQDANEWFNDQDGTFRFVSLPLGGEGITSTWDKQYSGVESSGAFFDVSNISFNTSIPLYQTYVTALTTYQLDSNIFNFLPLINGKYILLREDVDYRKRDMSNPVNVKDRLEGWVKDGKINERYNDGEITIYEVNESYFWPKIYPTRNIFVSKDNDLAKLSGYLTDYPEEKLVIVNDIGAIKDLKEQKHIVFPKEIFTQKVTIPLPKDLTEEDLLSRLFYTKHLPDRWYYPVIKLKEKVQEISQTDYYGWIIYKNGILGKRASEIYKLKRKGADEDIILKAEENYKNKLEELIPAFLGVVKMEGAISDLVKNTLLYQWLLLDEVDSSVSERLSDLLVNWGVKPKFELPVSSYNYLIYSFDLSSSDKYMIDSKAIDDQVDIYLDGEIVTDKTVHKLELGQHEIAVSTRGMNVHQDQINSEDILVDNFSLQSWNIDIPDILSKYVVDFDYRFVKGDSFDIGFNQDIDESDSPIFTHGIRKEEMYHGWKHIKMEFTTSPGADWGQFKFLPAEKYLCKRNYIFLKNCSDEEIEFEVEVKNFNISLVNYPEVVLVSDNHISMERSNTLITWDKINPAFYKLNVVKNDDSPELLVFSELYNSLWEAVYDDGTTIPEENHYLVNFYANAWLIDRQGEYGLFLKYAPLGILSLSKKVSIISCVSAVIFIGLLSWKQRKESKI